MRRDPRVNEFVAEMRPELAPIGRAARALLHKEASSLAETLRWGHPGYVGRADVAYIIENPRWVNLGFFRGIELADPEGLLEGTGKGMRHVKLRSVADARRPAVAALVRAAVALDGATVKVRASPRRPPKSRRAAPSHLR